MLGTLTGKEGANSECWLKPVFFCNDFVLHAQFDIQGIRKDNGFLVLDTDTIVKFAHHVDESCRITRVLSDTCKRLSIRRLGFVICLSIVHWST